jgi:endonuclease/exonuclease/phosphatase family metal-dependent hydrolase
LKEYKLAYNSRKRIALNAILEIHGELVQVCNVHLDLRINIKDRINQIADVLDKLNSHHIQKIIMGGDFNTVPIYWAGRMFPILYSRQRSKFNAFVHSKGFQTRLADIGYTMHQKIIKFSLDSIYTKGLDVSAFGIERDIKVSDHKPVWVDLEL